MTSLKLLYRRPNQVCIATRVNCHYAQSGARGCNVKSMPVVDNTTAQQCSQAGPHFTEPGLGGNQSLPELGGNQLFESVN